MICGIYAHICGCSRNRRREAPTPRIGSMAESRTGPKIEQRTFKFLFLFVVYRRYLVNGRTSYGAIVSFLGRYKHRKQQQTTTNNRQEAPCVVVKVSILKPCTQNIWYPCKRFFSLMTSLGVMLKRRDFLHKVAACCLWYLYLSIKFEMEGINAAKNGAKLR